jgi:threonine aldolase
VLFPRQANSVFVQLPEPAIAELRARGWKFYTFIGQGGCRFMCSWDTTEHDVRMLAADMAEALGGANPRMADGRGEPELAGAGRSRVE